MISATLTGYWLYRNDAVVVLDWKIVLKFGFEKRGIFNKNPFLLKRTIEISEKELLDFINKRHPW